jgi:hypothetical protein
MERPKSAKHNLERFKKSNTNVKIVNQHLNNSINDSDSMNESLIIQTPPPKTHSPQMQPVAAMRTSSKSAHVSNSGNFYNLRPQSARHNLEKYRHDVIMEQKRKKEKNKHLQNQIRTEKSTLSNDIELIDDDEKDIDVLDSLNIRDEDDSSSDIEIDDNNNNNNNQNDNYSRSNKKQQNNKISSTKIIKRSSLLERRNNNNKNQNDNQQKQQNQQPKIINSNKSLTAPVTTSKHLNPIEIVNGNINKSRSFNNHKNISYNTNLQPSSSENYHNSRNNSSKLSMTNMVSSSSSLSTSSSLNKQQPQIIHLNSNQNESCYSIDKKKRPTAVYENDFIETPTPTLNDYQISIEKKVISEIDSILYNKSDRNNSNHNKSQPKQQQQSRSHQQQTNRNISKNSNYSNSNQIILTKQNNNNYQPHRRTSNHSNNTNSEDNSFNNNNDNTPTNMKEYYNIKDNNNSNNRKSSDLTIVDQWSKRDRALIAQNVLLKHKIDVEKIAASREKNNISIISNASSLISAPQHQHSNSNLNISTKNSNTNLNSDKYYKK